MSQSPRTVLPFVQEPELPSGGTLSSISLLEPFPQYVAIMTPFLTKAPLSRLRMRGSLWQAIGIPKPTAPIGPAPLSPPTKSCTSPSSLSSPPHDTPHLRGPRKRQSPPGSLSLWGCTLRTARCGAPRSTRAGPRRGHLYVFPSPIADTAAGRSSRTATANTPYDRMMSPNAARSIFILRPLKVSLASAGFAWGSYTSHDIRRSPALTFTKKPKARTVLCTLDTPRCP